jgi:lincosamide nucleotidyltransferase A/C/D/E
MQTPPMTGAMSVDQAQAIYELLDRNGVRCWVMGGWGVDALLGRVTREHKDLDLLVLITDLPRYTDIVQQHGFERKLAWSESRPMKIDAVQFDSAFVDAHPDGREIDVHAIDVDREGVVTQFHTDPWPLPRNAISGTGTIEGVTFHCVTPAAQIAMHSGYDLPEKHCEDVRLLQAAN